MTIGEAKVCFRCGEKEPVYMQEPDHVFRRCMSCGEVGVATIHELMDLVNDMYLKGELTDRYKNEQQEQEEEIDLPWD